MSLVDVPGRLTADQAGKLPEVIISEEYAGKTYTGVDRSYGPRAGCDERNRLLYLVAHVTDPYGMDPAQPESALSWWQVLS
ncbi:MAG: hypothetical protein R3F38_01820 [Gammaproteobacteria bacterium]